MVTENSEPALQIRNSKMCHREQEVIARSANLHYKGGLLWVMSARNGEKLAEYKLEAVFGELSRAVLVWDGMAAANGRLYLATLDGKIICFAGK